MTDPSEMTVSEMVAETLSNMAETIALMREAIEVIAPEPKEIVA